MTVVVRRRPLPGREAEFEASLRDLVARLESAPGHRGTGIVRPAAGQREYTLVARFDSAEQAAEWEASGVRAEWLDLVEPFSDGQPLIERQPGLEFWFTPPGSPALRQPPRWKMAVLTVLALYPVSLTFGLLLTPHLLTWPLALRTLLSAVLVVSVMTYLVMPFITRVFAGWLRGEGERGDEAEIS
ncbi:antibiotic biosynthesis monooxygenase [Deinococcus irradiatisoli]|uniref:Antibiotic biosynthesis monooxygenase n=1 Tax=Deinococcus irradiatisoli TaxID=2202254 RepID=A0A2Z3JVG1_9DEIO|nr:antibiotic biosynthesis monooxygenase [Deinococcus irradiatisoli]